MKILVLGSDGRAHALVWKLFNSPGADLLCAPGNGGMTQLAPQVELDPASTVEVARWAFSEQIDLIIPADSGPLAAGLVDEVVAMHIGVCGPSQRSTRLEQSRCYARSFLERHGLPLPRGRACADLTTAEKYLATRPLPVRIKADHPDGGDAVYQDRYAALEGLRALFANRPAADSEGVVIEDAPQGGQVSFSALTDGSAALPLLPARIYEGLGPEPDSPAAPAMGALSGNSDYSRRLGDFLHRRLITPIVAALASEQLPYWGFLGVDCIITEQGPLISGLRCSLRDMEAQVVLPRLEGDLLPLIEASIARRLDRVPPPVWRDEACVGIALVAQGYPHHAPFGGAIEGLNELDPGVLVFHDQTHSPRGMRYTQAGRSGGVLSGMLSVGFVGGPAADVSLTGGHVLTVVASGATLAGARGRALLNAERIRFPGRIFREDIAAHEHR